MRRCKHVALLHSSAACVDVGGRLVLQGLSSLPPESEGSTFLIGRPHTLTASSQLGQYIDSPLFLTTCSVVQAHAAPATFLTSCFHC